MPDLRPGPPPRQPPRSRRAQACTGRSKPSPTASPSSATPAWTCSPPTRSAGSSTQPIIGDGGRTPNLARFQFLDPASHDFYPDWDRFAHMCVAIMRTEAGRDPHDRGLQDLVGELSTQSETFRRLWGAHDVRTHGTGTKRFHHPDVGELTLAYEELAITAEPGTPCSSTPPNQARRQQRSCGCWHPLRPRSESLYPTADADRD